MTRPPLRVVGGEEPPRDDDEHAPSFTSADDADREPFECDKDGKIYISQANIILALKKLEVTVRYNEFADHELIDGLPGFGPRLDDAAMNRLRMAIDSHFGFRVGKELFFDVVTDQARLNRYHPVRDYLDARKWDEVQRVDTWLIDYAGAADTPYVRAVSRLVLVAAVRRARSPGAKFDEMPILESPQQGTEKSTAVETLCPDPAWFTDNLPLAATTQRLMEATAGKWIVEAGELKGMNKGDVAALKAWLSRRVDEARMSYGRKNTIAPRQFIVIGTTNETESYLKDTTGNRRFWPVRIQRFDLSKLRKDRDQLWAEAAHYEANGESIRLDPTHYDAAGAEQDARRLEDPLVPLIREALGELTGKLRALDAWRIVNIEPGKATQDQMARLGAAMRELGWERSKRRFGGGTENAYVRGSDAETAVALEVAVTGLATRPEVTITRSKRL